MKILESEIQLDVHTHTIASGHAYGTIREMAQAAREKDVKLLGISEHSQGIPGTCDHMYFRNIEVIPRHIYGVDLLIGGEINILNNGKLSMDYLLMSKLDYRIAGIHTQCYEPESKQKNTENVLSAIENPLIQIIAHPDDGGIPLDYEQIVLAAKENHTLLEVNNNSLRKKGRRLHCKENYMEMLDLCKKYKTEIIFSSDAHDPQDVKNIKYIKELFEDMEFPRDLIVNLSIEKFKQYL